MVGEIKTYPVEADEVITNSLDENKNGDEKNSFYVKIKDDKDKNKKKQDVLDKRVEEGQNVLNGMMDNNDKMNKKDNFDGNLISNMEKKKHEDLEKKIKTDYFDYLSENSGHLYEKLADKARSDEAQIIESNLGEDSVPKYGSNKIMVLKSEMKETASFYERSKSISNLLESISDESQVSLDWKKDEVKSFLQQPKRTKVYF